MKILDPLANQPVPAPVLNGLTLALLGSALPHVRNLDPGLLAFFGLMVLWRLLANRRPDRLPGRGLLRLATLLGLALVTLRAPLDDSLLTGTALLLVMSGLKLLEIRSRRDVRLTLMLGHFLLLTDLLFHPDLWLAFYVLLLAGALLALQASLSRARFRAVDLLPVGIRLVLPALPVAMLLFLFFPRLDGPLWELSRPGARALSGIDDEMRLGSIGELIRSGRIAFRVRFRNEPPAREHLYWRGPVLWRFDGLSWRSADPGGPAPPQIEGDPTSRTAYELILEPSNRTWVFALDLPIETKGLRQGADASLQAPRPLVERKGFRLDALTRYRLTGLTPAQREAALQLPVRVDPRVRELAQGWRRAHPRDDAAVARAALGYFREQPFVYTLSPGVARGDPIAHFLFDSRRGFCEHYAGSMALLMRLAGIPARVVLGYQGGEPNPLADHWVVRQSDAHAWVEVWLPGSGWTRMDPTAAVAPQRIELGIDPVRSADSPQVTFERPGGDWMALVLRQGRWLMDALDQRWYRWVVSFDRGRQRGLMERLGLSKMGRHAPLFVVAAILAGTVLTWTVAMRLARQRDPDPARRLWKAYRQHLRHAGLDAPDWLGPRQVLKQALQRWPEQGETLRAFTRDYLALRYGPDPDPALLRILRRRLRRLRLPPS